MRNFFFYFQLSKELGFPIVANAQLTFTKCLEMKLQDHIEVIAKVAEIAGKEYSIEQVNNMLWFPMYKVTAKSGQLCLDGNITSHETCTVIEVF